MSYTILPQNFDQMDPEVKGHIAFHFWKSSTEEIRKKLLPLFFYWSPELCKFFGDISTDSCNSDAYGELLTLTNLEQDYPKIWKSLNEGAKVELFKASFQVNTQYRMTIETLTKAKNIETFKKCVLSLDSLDFEKTAENFLRYGIVLY